MNRQRVARVVDRELRSIARSRALLVLSIGYAGVTVVLAWTGGPTGFVPVVLTLVTPMEVLVPALAVAFGYRAILDDARRGELEILRTFPVSRREFVAGVFLGRATGVVLVVVVPLVLAGGLVGALGGTRSTVFVTHGGVDSLLLYVRFVVLTAVYSMVVLAMALAVSTLARSVRGATALGVGLLLVLVVGFDLGAIGGLASGAISDDSLVWALAFSPNSAYRGLVLELVVGPLGSTAVAAPARWNLLGLTAWGVGALALSVRTVWGEGA